MGDFNSKFKFNERQLIMELLAFEPLMGQYPIYSVSPKRGSFTDHDVIEVIFNGAYEDNYLTYIVEVVPSIHHPHSEPAAVLIDPDAYTVAKNVGIGENPHLYRDFNNRRICAHHHAWNSNSNLAQYFINCCVPFANNFTAMLVLGPTIWPPSKWLTGGGKE